MIASKLQNISTYVEGSRNIPPFLKWAGGKRWLATNHTNLVPTNFENFFEPFLGSGALFFRLQPSRAILSDINSELISSYRAIRDNWKLLEDELRVHQRKHSKKYYYEIRSRKCRTEHTRAARFIYLNRTCWNGLYRVNLRNEFNVPIGTKSSVILDTDNFEEVAGLLSQAELRVRDFEDVIGEAKSGDFVFVDPPYTVKHNYNGFVKYNDRLFSWDDQIRLRDSVVRASLRGAQVLVLNANHDSIRKLYTGVGRQISLPRSSVLAASSAHRINIEELAICTW